MLLKLVPVYRLEVIRTSLCLDCMHDWNTLAYSLWRMRLLEPEVLKLFCIGSGELEL